LEVRLNKCITGLSRRAADEAIVSQLVTVNFKPAVCGMKVRPGDIVQYKGVVQHWRAAAAAKLKQPAQTLEHRDLIYLKYWKPVGVTCTSDHSDPSNIIAAGKFQLLPQRVFNVGRLDKDSSGLILLTSDGRVNNALLSSHHNKEKTYVVETDSRASDEQIAQMAAGVLITTPIQRDSSRSPSGSRTTDVTTRTLPCYVKRVNPTSANSGKNLLQFTLREGRNRQIRRMTEAVGLTVVGLHRTSFAGIGLKGVSEGNWAELSADEMKIIRKSLDSAKGT
jgi:pseudouridine synthase